MNQEAIGKFISQCRKKKKLTQNELASIIGVTDKAVSKWENGRCLPDLSLIKPLCEELDITMNELLNGNYISNEEIKERSEENLNSAFSYFKKETKKKKQKILILSVVIILITITFSSIFIKNLQAKKYNSVENSIIIFNEHLNTIKEKMDELATKDENGNWISLKNYNNKTTHENNINNLVKDINYCYNFLNNNNDINNLKIYIIKGKVTKNELNYFNENQANLTCLNTFEKYKDFYLSEDKENQDLYNTINIVYSVKETPLFRKEKVTFSELNTKLVTEVGLIEYFTHILYGEYRRNYEV